MPVGGGVDDTEEKKGGEGKEGRRGGEGEGRGEMFHVREYFICVG